MIFSGEPTDLDRLPDPAAPLRDPSRKKDVWEDMKSVIRKYRELVDPQHHSPHYPL